MSIPAFGDLIFASKIESLSELALSDRIAPFYRSVTATGISFIEVRVTSLGGRYRLPPALRYDIQFSRYSICLGARYR